MHIRNSLTMSFLVNGQKMMHAAVNTDPLTMFEEKQPQHYGLKERQIVHVKITEANELKQWYDFGEKIGEGGFGVVLSVLERSTTKYWAMKIVTKTINEDRLKLLHREIQILKLIKHPHIIYLDRIYESSQKIYMVFEKCYGELAKIYHERKPFPEQVARKMIKELSDAVAYLHKYDIVHRDLKMENILIGENPTDPSDEYYIKLTDFGLSIVKYGRGIDSMLHDYCGTVYYMSPEMITSRSYSQQCDMWAIGVILYMMVNGNYPFHSKIEKDLQHQICTNNPNFNNTKLSYEVTDLILSLLTKDPANRITATEVLQHPWILNRKLSKGAACNYNILQMMKEWKSEMTVPTGKESDWVSSINNIFEEVKNQRKQPLNLPRTNISFDRSNKGNSSRQRMSNDKNNPFNKTSQRETVVNGTRRRNNVTGVRPETAEDRTKYRNFK